MGDVVQALPVLRLIKSHFPRSEVYWWLAPGLLPLLQGDPHLAGIFAFERGRWKSPWNWNEVLRSIHEMRSYRFDWVIDLQGLARSGLFAWLANGQFTTHISVHPSLSIYTVNSMNPIIITCIVIIEEEQSVGALRIASE